MRIFLITPYGKDYPIAERVAEDLLDEGESVYNPAALYASPEAPVGNHLLLRETLPKLLDAEAVLYLPGWMGDPMALMHASIAQAINLVQWIPSDPLPVIEEEEPSLAEDDEYGDWEWVGLSPEEQFRHPYSLSPESYDFSQGERGKYASVTFEPLAETEDAPLHRDSGDEHKEPRA